MTFETLHQMATLYADLNLSTRTQLDGILNGDDLSNQNPDELRAIAAYLLKIRILADETHVDDQELVTTIDEDVYIKVCQWLDYFGS